MINRNEEFARCKEANLQLSSRDQGRQARVPLLGGGAPASRSAAERRRRADSTAKTPGRARADRVRSRHRATRRDAAAQAGRIVRDQVPEQRPGGGARALGNVRVECARLFIVGALGGYPLIKQAMNQGYEVVETILGRKIAPPTSRC
jgi:hypothetical protein